MEYSIEYTISSDIVFKYNTNRRDPKFIYFRRYETKFKTGYLVK